MAHPENIGPYRLEKILGSGGMGKVFQAYDERLDRRVAIKQIRPDRNDDDKVRKRFRREARAVAHLSHPAIVQIFDIVEEEDEDWIVMELAQGSDVARLVKESPLSIADAVQLGIDLADGLTEAHEAGIVHRDLKGENVIVTPRGRAKILDFGLAKRLWGQQSSLTLSRDGMIVGTCRAMSPEQTRGEEVGPACDLFSLGTLLYEMLTSHSPFLSSTPGQTLVRVRTYHPPPVTQLREEIPEDLATLIKRLHLKDPAKRPPNAEAVAATLRAISQSIPGDSQAVDPGISRAPHPVSTEARHDDGLSDASTLYSGLQGDTTPDETSDAEITSAASHAVSPVDVPSDLATGERRLVTVLHCELSPVDETFDAPEELLGLVDAFRQMAGHVLETYGVTPRQDEMLPGLTVYFGYPRAHPNDTRQAAYAAREIIEEFRARQAAGTTPGNLAIRAGIHTGFGAVLAKNGHEILSVGHLVQVATGLQGLAEDGQIVVSGDTRLLLGGSFIYQEFLGRIPGMTGPLPYFRLLDTIGSSQQIEVALAQRIAQVARNQELEQILERWELARQASGQVVLLSGGAGMGKTRLVSSLKTRLIVAERVLIEWNCTSLRQNTAFHPVVSFAERFTVDANGAGVSSPDHVPQPLTRLPLVHFVNKCAEILKSPSTPSKIPLALSPEGHGRKLQELMAAVILELAESQPVLLVVEDVQWADPSTLGLISVLIDQAPTASILVVISFRREWEPPWHSRSYMTQVTLSPLPQKHAAVLVDMLTEDAPLPPKIRDEIAERSDGVPLFIEELTRLVQGTDLDNYDGSAIPSTLQGWLTARLDRLGKTKKKLAQLASFFGREFPYDLLRACSRLSEPQLRQQLEELVNAELLHYRGQPPRASYTFRHALLRDAAYDSVLKTSRKTYHQRIAKTLREDFPELAEKSPEVLAHHYTAAGEDAMAVPLWLRAAELATRSAAYTEASSYVRKGLRLLDDLAPSEEHRHLEIRLQIIRGTALGIPQSYALPEVEKSFSKARDLWENGDKDPELFPWINSLAVSYLFQGRVRLAHELLQEIVQLAEEVDDVDFLPSAYWSMGLTLLMLGDFKAVQHYVEEGIAYYATQLSLEPKLPPGTGLAVATSLGDLSWALWFLGDIDQSLDCSTQSLDLMRHSPDDHAQAFALFRAGYLHVFRREPDRVEKLADRLIRFSERLGFIYHQGMGMFLKGRALIWQGRGEEGLWMMSESLDGAWAAGRAAARGMHLGVLAEACLELGKISQGLSLIREALSTLSKDGGGRFEAELQRLWGELLLAGDGAEGEEIESHFQNALEIARRQNAGSLELRAATSLARWWRDHERWEDARQLLGDVLESFNEGLETRDLLDATALLGELTAKGKIATLS